MATVGEPGMGNLFAELSHAFCKLTGCSRSELLLGSET